ncbi:6-phosphogluconolactonase [Neolewinella xylanilytica]|uniref:6-phosphogluconolactonase n=1 Tax=Neolewinella xylanilytica TaxID=1514080 RepID=A0A2S6IBP9_9BACT|nr:beta-propeller fold lactonase family protein [Neolewinella xylanilytica]PPK88892.1 6-phosphogluconolactonase [Neolewinella xylanilytica]
MLLLVGAYTIDMEADVPGLARGVTAYDFSPKLGQLDYRGYVEEVNPSYLCIDPANPVAYAVRECPQSDGAAVVAYHLRRGARNAVVFDRLGEVLLQGDHPCHVTKVEDTLIVSCYSSGSVHVVGLHPDGRPASHRQRLSLHHDTQRTHAHCAVYDAKRKRVYVCDLGGDQLTVFDRSADGTLTARPAATVRFPQGSGPRHCVLHPNGDLLLVNCEFRGRVAVVDLRGEAPQMAINVPALPERAVEGASGAAIRIDQRGRNVYISERNYSVVSTLRLETEAPLRLFTRDTYPSGGTRPRDIALSPDGKWLLSANLKDHSIGVFRVGAGGALQLQRVVRKVKSPTSLTWIPGL